MAQKDSQSTQYLSLSSATTRGIPHFLLSLYEIVTDQTTDHLVRWSPEGDSFFILEPVRFARELLDKWFKTNQYASFLRQLHNYGFQKVRHLQQGALRPSAAAEYDHYAHSDSKFLRDRRDLLTHIQRKSQTAQNHPVQPIVVNDPSPPVSMPEFAAAGDDSREQQLERVLLEIDTLKRRQKELDAENMSLRDALKTMGQQVQFVLRLVASLGLYPIAEHQWTMRGNQQLMIQGIPGKVEVGEATPGRSDQSIDSRCLNDQSANSPSIQAHLTSQPSSVWEPYESTGHSESDLGNINTSSAGDCSGQSYHAQNYRGDLTGSLNSSDLLQPSTEMDSCYLDAHNCGFVDPPMENLNGFNQFDCVGENDAGSFYHTPSSLSGYNNEAVTGSDMPTSSGIPGTHPPSIDPPSPVPDVTGEKRKATVMDDLEHTEPRCAPTHPSPSLFSFQADAQPTTEFVSPTSLHLLPSPPLW